MTFTRTHTLDVEVVATVTVEGFHHWPSPTPHRDYLGHRHRHIFHVTAAIAVRRSDREIEAHDLEHRTRLALTNTEQQGTPPAAPFEFGPLSCEQIAAQVAADLADFFGTDRTITVTVLEDGEAGARVTRRP